MEKADILKIILGSFTKRGDEHLFHCPYCKHQKRKLSVNFIKNAWKCWVCDKSGLKVFQLVKRFGSLEDIKRWVAVDDTASLTETDAEIVALFNKPEKKEYKITLPSEFISLCNDNLPYTSIMPLRYLKSRGIAQEDIKKWRIGYCSHGAYENRIVIPSFDLEGDINFFEARTYVGERIKYRKPEVPKNEIIFNELMIDWSRPIYLVEGVFDAISIGDNAVPLLGSTLSRKHKLFKEIAKNNSQVYLALDEDANFKLEKIIALFRKYNIRHSVVNTTGFEDIAEMPKSEVDERIANAIVPDEYDFILNRLGAI